jgi:hypothetical protein
MDGSAAQWTLSRTSAGIRGANPLCPLKNLGRFECICPATQTDLADFQEKDEDAAASVARGRLVPLRALAHFAVRRPTCCYPSRAGVELMSVKRFALGFCALLACVQSGCALIAYDVATPNPLIVPNSDFERVWNETVKVVDDYFTISSENRLSHRIITDPVPGATLLEPWYGDSVGFYERLESSLQTIRRHAEVTVDPAPNGGFAVKVVVYKELEDLAKPDRQTAGRATFTDNFPVNRTREIVGPVPLPLQWIPVGRDYKLERVILNRIRKDLFL